MLRRAERNGVVPLDDGRRSGIERRDGTHWANGHIRRRAWISGERAPVRPEIRRQRRQTSVSVDEEGAHHHVVRRRWSAVLNLCIESIHFATSWQRVYERLLEVDVARDRISRLIARLRSIDLDVLALPPPVERRRREWVGDAGRRGLNAARVDDVIAEIDVDRRRDGDIERPLPHA